MKFELNGQPYIELNKLLKILSLVESGGQANLFITDGQVLLNGEVETRKRKKLFSKDVIQLFEHTITIK